MSRIVAIDDDPQATRAKVVAAGIPKFGSLENLLNAYGTVHAYRTRYLLAKLTQIVEMAFKGMSAPGPLSDFTTLEIEHIMPNTPEAELRASFSAANPEKSYDDYKTRLGNLAMLEKPINIVAGNGFFETKKTEYVKSGNYLTRSIAGLNTVGKNSSITRINSKLQAFEAWSAAQIDLRQDMLIGLAKDVWTTNPVEAD